MKRLLLTFIAFMAINAYAQQQAPTIETLQKQLTSLEEQIKALESRVASVEQLNSDLRKAIHFGKAITSATDLTNDVTYNIISVKGSEANRTIKITMQVVANSEKQEIYLMRNNPYIINLNGETKTTYSISFDNGQSWTVHPEAPVLAYLIFEEINPDNFREIKLLHITPSVDFNGVPLKFTDLMVEWE